MSAKSRKRNKRLLALAGIITAGTLAAKNKRNASIDKGIKSAEDDSGSDMLSKKTNYITKKDTSKSDVAPVAKKDTSKNTGTKYKSRMLRKNPEADGKVMGPGETAIFNAKNKMPDTPPPSIDNPYSSRVIKGGRNFGNSRALKNGGRAGLKSGGKAIKKSMGKALRGGGKVMR